ncbi:amidase, partial [Methylopila musalis]
RAGETSACGSAIRRDWTAPSTADALTRLDRAGAVTLGRLAMSEFAVGPIGLNAHNGPTRNPWNPAHVSGGSSSGPAAAVAARTAFGALGSDTGASIRVPSAACGVVGLKPSPGLISTAGSMPLSSSLDVVGPIARRVGDVALLTAVLARPVDPDLASPAHPAFLDAAFAPVEPPRGLRLGVPRGFFRDGLAPDVSERFEAAAAAFRDLGVTLVDVDDAAFAEAGPLYGAILGAEAASTHARLLRAEADAYSPQVRARLLAGLGVEPAAYAAALARRAPLLVAALSDVFARADLLLAPVLRDPVPTIAEVDVGDGPRMAEVVAGFLRLTNPMNVLGLPALSLPAGFTSNGLPCGVQLVGPPMSDILLLKTGRAYERAVGWTSLQPTAPAPAPAAPPHESLVSR